MLGWILVFTLSMSLLFCLCRSGLALISFGNSILNMVPGRPRTTSRLTSEGPCTAGILLPLFTRVFVAQLLLARHCLLMQRVEMALAPSSWEDRHRIRHCALDVQGHVGGGGGGGLQEQGNAHVQVLTWAESDWSVVIKGEVVANEDSADCAPKCAGPCRPS